MGEVIPKVPLYTNFAEAVHLIYMAAATATSAAATATFSVVSAAASAVPKYT